MKLSIMQKMLLFILMPVILGLAAVTLFNYNAARTALNNQIGEELQLVLSGQKNELTNTVALLGTTMDNFGRDAEVVEYLRGKSDPTLMSLGESARLERHLQESIDLLSKEYALLRDVGLADISGTVLLHSTASFVGSNIADREYFQAALRDEVRPTTIESKANGLLSSALGLPVKDGDRIVGVVYGTLDLGKMADSTTDTVHIARTGKCFVYDKTGRLLMHPNKDYIGDDDSGLPWVEHMLTSPAGRYDYEWNGSDMLGYFDRVPMVDWLIIVSVEESDIHAPVSAMFRQSLLVGGLAMLIVGLVIVLVARGIAGTLKAMAVLVEKLARGDLSLTELEERSMSRDEARGDEIGVMARGTRGMLEGLRRLFAESEQKTAEAKAAAEQAAQAAAEANQARSEAENARRDGMLAAARQLETVVEIVSSASAELSAQIEESEHGAERQAARMAETATAMEEMNATVLEVARNAGAAAEVSDAARQRAEAGAVVVEKAVTGIRKVREQSLSLKQDMAALAENARSIGSLMSVISDIADQTNLLALNAAIEAARAGEAGRGFAVVADEVRKLAEKTMSATNHVGDAIKDIQASTAKSMEQVDGAVLSIEEATELANQSGAALGEIVGMVDKAADQVRAIAAASEQQSAASEEINASITQVNNIAAETAQAMEQSTQAVAELAEQAQTLSTLIADMKNS
ncbi:MAG TPA: methyl-accepting chemotaxis protein [Candidatus Mailhella merdigallinarum]|uniref:Methyl-accepting chemotaxis protein n=1 Tax=Candidatus Mailhella merdigallinarum TaxID=2838658 RepID=A0A9D2HEV7_9BACT|nr:methyl-accepting chemotaxis protein [Candidatus Mailhella merdigallinarum]